MTKNYFDLTGKVAVVTGSGANGGIGHAIAVGFAQHGASLVVSDINTEGAQQTFREIEALGGKSSPWNAIYPIPNKSRNFFQKPTGPSAE